MARSFLSKSKPLFAGVAALFLLAACPDPGERFEEFVDRTKGIAFPAGELGKSRLENLGGRFLLFASVQLAPTNPLIFDVAITSNVREDGTCPQADCRISLKVQPLVNPKAGCANPFEPVGDVIDIPDVPLAPDGSFTAALGVVDVDGCANPITGREIQGDLTLESVTKSPDVFCGKLNGQVIKPVPLTLTSSTFGAVRITTEPKQVNPLPVLLACPPDENGTGGAGGVGGAGGEGGGAGGA